MRDNNLKWSTFTFFSVILIAVLGIMWAKLEKIDDGLGMIRQDVAIIKQAVGLKATITGLFK